MENPQFVENARVVDREGAEIGTLRAIEEGEAGSIVIARTPDGREVGIPYEQIDLRASTDEEVVADLLVASLEIPSEGVAEDHYATLTLSEEDLDVSTRWAEKGRVIVRKRVETVPQEKTIELAQEGVEVERVRINDVVDELPQVRTEGETTIIPVVEEVLIVEKRYRLVEEVRVTSTRSSQPHTIREDLRREVVEFEEVPPEEGTAER
ncbi:MAG TPA: YsnF/AvaK domain-containing protein [Thermomicrobiales bacterium]|nr:YsnF/AvaK domain-containing protein [Thermomicrobiales bacterium]